MVLVRRTTGWCLVAGVLAILSSTGGRAQGSPINTDAAFVNGLEGGAFRSFVFSVRRSGLLDKGETVTDPLDRDVTVYGIPIVVPYEVLRNRLVVAPGIPVLHKQMKLGREEQKRTIANSGFGDAFVGAKLLLAQRDREGQTTRIALSGAIKLPTGDDTQRDEEGNLLPPPL